MKPKKEKKPKRPTWKGHNKNREPTGERPPIPGFEGINQNKRPLYGRPSDPPPAVRGETDCVQNCEFRREHTMGGDIIFCDRHDSGPFVRAPDLLNHLLQYSKS